MYLIKPASLSFLVLFVSSLCAQADLVEHVNPFLGTAPLTEKKDIGYEPPEGWRVWAGLVFPGASVPNAMVQLSPITEFGSGAGYEYEDDTIYAFTHTNKGHWNLCHIPMLPVCGEFSARDFGSGFSHKNETASPGYYQVFLERYQINAELTSTLRCGYHKYTFEGKSDKKLIVDLGRSNERVRRWEIEQDGESAFKGYQRTGRDTVYFYATSNYKIAKIEFLKSGRSEIPLVHFADSAGPVEIKVGLSFVSTDNAKDNLRELAGKTFEQVKNEASVTWEALLSKITVSGGTERQKEIFYSSLYRSFLWPALRSDLNGEFTDVKGDVVKKDFRYYTVPSLWDTYRNKLVLLGMLAPEVTSDVIASLIDRGEKTGFIPTFFHGDHAAAFIAGSFLRGVRDYDVQSAYRLLLHNATVEGTRPHLNEYIEKGYISTPKVERPDVETKAKAGVTKTLEYAYDDYAVALLAKVLDDKANYEMLMKRAGNYKNVFDPSTGLMRGRLANGDWVEPFNAEFPYYEYMYREANAWQSTFFAPHDVAGLIGLYKSKDEFEKKLDTLFTKPWNEKYIARNVSGFIGQYCHGNQPDHSTPYMYYFVGKQEKSQRLIDRIMTRFYGMGKDGLALCGMDDAGEMSSWYVFNAIGFYPLSPADPKYIVTVPMFDKVELQLGDGDTCTIIKKNSGSKIEKITCDQKTIDGYFISHEDLKKGKELTITTK